MWKAFVTLWSLGLVLVASGHTEETIAYGKRVSLQYTLTLEDQTVIDTSVEEKPLTGLQVGDGKKIRVPPKEGYGNFDPKRLQEVPKESVPERERFAEGALQALGPLGAGHTGQSQRGQRRDSDY